MRDDGLNFDVYVDIETIDIVVDFNDFEDRVEMVLGDETHLRGGCLHLWFREPDSVIDLLRKIAAVEEKFTAHRTQANSTD